MAELTRTSLRPAGRRPSTMTTANAAIAAAANGPTRIAEAMWAIAENERTVPPERAC